MRPKLAAHAAEQGGLVTRTQAVAAGYSTPELRSLTRTNGPWIVIRRGVYMERAFWSRLEDYVERPAVRARAASLTMKAAHVLSHDSTGAVHGLSMLRPKDPLVHVTRHGVTGSRTEHGVKHHTALYRVEQVVEVAGVRLLDRARTAVDLGREHGYVAGLVACDSALQLGTTRGELRRTVADMQHWPHVARTRAAVDDADPGAESVGETLARILVQELNLGAVETQFCVESDGGVHWADLRVGRHLVEFDGRIKYVGRENGGLATEAPEQVVWAEKTRQDQMCAMGFGMSRLVWTDLWGAKREQTRQRLRREYAVTESRFGSQLPEGYRHIPRRRTRVK